MHPTTMTRIVGGKRYSTKTAALVASDEYWDGHNWERSGRNTFLYRTPLGAWFTVSLSQWQGERDVLEPVSEEEAREYFEGPLTEHEMTWAEAFQREPEEPVGERGRPTMYDEKMRQVGLWLPEHMIEWLRSQDGGVSETVRALIEAAMTAEGKHG